MTAARLIIDAPAGGAWNMAVDEALLESAATASVTTLRFYQWDEPTLSLGYFQAANARDQHSASRACPLVRRSTGGGAIIHDRELTYSIALPHHDARKSTATELYDAFHQTLIATLADFDVVAGQHLPLSANCVADNEGRVDDPPFLCFQRPTCGDIVCGNAKIVGSAQRRRRGAILQHGSILLAMSACAPELPGIAELTGRQIDPQVLVRRWSQRLAERLSVRWLGGELLATEAAAARDLAAKRFGDAAYSSRR